MREVFIFMHALACVAILISGLAAWLKIIAIAAVGWLFYYHWQHWFIGLGRSPKKLSYSSTQAWHLTLCNDEKFPVVFCMPIWLSQWVSLLRVAELDDLGGKTVRRFSLIIFPQKNTQEEYRRMLVLLRFPQQLT